MSVPSATDGFPRRLCAFSFRHRAALIVTGLAASLFLRAIFPLYPDFSFWKLLLMVFQVSCLCLLFMLFFIRARLASHINRLLREALDVCRNHARFPSTFPYCLGKRGAAPTDASIPPDDSATLARLLKTLESTRPITRNAASSDLVTRLLHLYQETQVFSGYQETRGETLRFLLAKTLAHVWFVRRDFDAFWRAIGQIRQHRLRLRELEVFREWVSEAALN